MTAVLWDLDGTLADTAVDIALHVDEMLEASGLAPLGLERVRAYIGDGARSLVDRCVVAAGGAPTPAHVARFMAAYRARPRRQAGLYPGIEALLAAVVVPQAVVTNKPEAVSRALLAELGVLHRFGALIGGDTLPERKPHAAPLRRAMAELGVERAVMVGDGPHDVGGAHAAGLSCIGVTWGIAQPVGADHTVATVAELRVALAELGACR